MHFMLCIFILVSMAAAQFRMGPAQSQVTRWHVPGAEVDEAHLRRNMCQLAVHLIAQRKPDGSGTFGPD